MTPEQVRQGLRFQAFRGSAASDGWWLVARGITSDRLVALHMAVSAILHAAARDTAIPTSCDDKVLGLNIVCHDCSCIH